MTSSLGRPILDFRFHKDPRSRSYRARDEVARTARFKRVWTTRKAGPLDQGREGECVGFACAGELAAKPAAFTVTDETGRKIFAAARSIDLSEGRDFPDGATVIAGLQACRRANYFLKFLWCFGIDDTINWIVRRGPVILGIPWYDGMYDPDTKGLLRVSGRLVGGHAIMANGFWPAHPQFGDVLVLTNSWGKTWGINGRAYLPVEDAVRLLSEDGEVAAPTDYPARAI
jgi:hypothetical protein